MSLIVLLAALLIRGPVYHCTADAYIPEHPCAVAHVPKGSTCILLRGQPLCW